MALELTLKPRIQLLQLLLLSVLIQVALCNEDGFEFQRSLRRKRFLPSEAKNRKYLGESISTPADGSLSDLWDYASKAARFHETSERYLDAGFPTSISMSISMEPSKSPFADPTIPPLNTPFPGTSRVPTSAPDPTIRPTAIASQAPLRPSPVPPSPILPTIAPPESCLRGRTQAEYLIEKLKDISNEEVLLDGSTSQGRAFRFLIDDPIVSRLCNSQTAEQRFALATLFFATQGGTWTRRDRWLGESHECEWFGVTCESQGPALVKRLELAFNNLDGRLPEEISALSMLEQLDLFANALTGTIPSGIANLSNLILIDVQENLLTGLAFPSSLFALGVLRGYRVNGNTLVGSIPTQVAGLQSLEQLWAADNDLTGSLPSELGSLPNLESLFLFGNSLLGSLPSEVGLLPLEDIRLNGNFLQGSIPTQLFNVGSLRSIRLDNNFFLGEIPPVLGQLTNLIDLRVNNNNFSGEIPSEIGLLTNLGKWCFKTGLYRTLRILLLTPEDSEYLLLNENFWRSNVPDVFTNYKRLDFFDISNTMVFGTIPSSLFSVSTLRIAYMSNCSLTGTIPASFVDPPLLRDLFLDGNMLTGEVPPVPDGKLALLNEFLIQRTRLSGTMPQSVCDLRRFNVLDDLWADCGGSNPEIFCDYPECCNRCFEGSGTSRNRIRLR